MKVRLPKKKMFTFFLNYYGLSPTSCGNETVVCITILMKIPPKKYFFQIIIESKKIRNSVQIEGKSETICETLE